MSEEKDSPTMKEYLSGLGVNVWTVKDGKFAEKNFGDEDIPSTCDKKNKVCEQHNYPCDICSENPEVRK